MNHKLELFQDVEIEKERQMSKFLNLRATSHDFSNGSWVHNFQHFLILRDGGKFPKSLGF